MKDILNRLCDCTSNLITNVSDRRLSKINHRIYQTTHTALNPAKSIFRTLESSLNQTHRPRIHDGVFYITKNRDAKTTDMSNSANDLIIDESKCLLNCLKRKRNSCANSTCSNTECLREYTKSSLNCETNRSSDRFNSETNAMTKCSSHGRQHCHNEIDRCRNNCFNSSPDSRSGCCSRSSNRLKNLLRSIDHSTKEVFLNESANIFCSIPSERSQTTNHGRYSIANRLHDQSNLVEYVKLKEILRIVDKVCSSILNRLEYGDIQSILELAKNTFSFYTSLFINFAEQPFMEVILLSKNSCTKAKRCTKNRATNESTE